MSVPWYAQANPTRPSWVDNYKGWKQPAAKPKPAVPFWQKAQTSAAPAAVAAPTPTYSPPPPRTPVQRLGYEASRLAYNGPQNWKNAPWYGGIAPGVRQNVSDFFNSGSSSTPEYLEPGRSPMEQLGYEASRLAYNGPQNWKNAPWYGGIAPGVRENVRGFFNPKESTPEYLEPGRTPWERLLHWGGRLAYNGPQNWKNAPWYNGVLPSSATNASAPASDKQVPAGPSPSTIPYWEKAQYRTGNPPGAPDPNYLKWRSAAEDQRTEFEQQQGDALRFPLYGERGWNSGVPLADQGPVPMPQEDWGETPEMPNARTGMQGPTSPLMQIPFAQSIAPFILSLVETAAQAQPGTFDASSPVGLTEPQATGGTVPGASITGPGSGITFTPKKDSEWEREKTPEYTQPPPGPLDRALKETWGNLEAEGATGLMDYEKNGGMTNRDAIVQAVVDKYNAQAAEGREAMARQKVREDDREEEFQPMTLEMWNSLTPEQQASAQFNENLQAAVQRDMDLANETRPTDAQREEYQAGVRRLFPENPTTYMLDYAPETLGLLETLDLQPALLDNTTMDDFIKLDVAITPKQMMNLDRELEPKFQSTGYRTTASGMPVPTGEMAYANPREERLALAQGLAAAQHQLNQTLMNEELEKGKRVLTSMTGAVANEAASADFGAVARQPLGADNRISTDGLKKLNAEDMNLFIEALARTPDQLDTTIAEINKEFDARGVEQKERDRVYEHLRNYAEQAALGNSDWWPGKTTSPQQVAVALGSVPLKRG